jgi:hypothetical protein
MPSSHQPIRLSISHSHAGSVKSLETLFVSPCGVTLLLVLAVAILLSIWGATGHDRLIDPIRDGDVVRPGAVKRLRLGMIVEMSCFGVILACM